MGLRLRLRPRERIIINGCVVTNGDRRNTITVSSFGQVLRSKDILLPENAHTPVEKLYLGIQMLLINISGTQEEIHHINRLGSFAFVSLKCEDEQGRLLSAMERMHQGDYYKALSELRPLIKSEKDKQAGQHDTTYPEELEQADAAFRASAEAQFTRLEKDHTACS